MRLTSHLRDSGVNLMPKLIADVLLHTAPIENRALFYHSLIAAILRGNPSFNSYLGSREVIVKFDGLKWAINKDTGLGALYAKYIEPVVYEIIVGSRGGLFVDIGANIGAYSLRAAKKFKNVLAIEPGYVANSHLLHNIQINDIQNVDLRKVAVSDKGGNDLIYSANSLVNWSLHQDYNKSLNSFEVQTVTLNELLAPFKEIDLVKIDVEDSELEVLKGGSLVLHKIRKIIIEVQNTHEFQALSLLRSYGFKCKCIEERESDKNWFCQMK